ncbi:MULTISPECIES: metal ABC transporter ATP-binding protein [unclassified Corynebacterium]|uniref:metal ABC transporter ATP-binding protein n=1 Tax=unclassified Corynebacterium TaxID=2624378 RepID=UPI002A90BD23|nr:metal ABC transporter ATP-binding protein [Corynebacterium sp.]MDY5785283.1 metal ABC transporter ATP-binding protein [Corynebacterium sp.]
MTARLIDATVTPLWEDISLHIGDGEMIAVTGPNGSGKSTLLKAIAGLRPLTRGSIEFSGRLGYIPQQQMFPPGLPLRARDVVALTVGRGAKRAHAEELLASVGAAHLSNRRVGNLSGGQQQLVRQAQALANRPDLILADEPFLSLDVARQRETAQRLRNHGAAVLLVTHALDPVLDMIDRVLYLGPRGHVLGPANEVLRSSVLSELYGTHVDVVNVHGKLVIV